MSRLPLKDDKMVNNDSVIPIQRDAMTSVVDHSDTSNGGTAKRNALADEKNPAALKVPRTFASTMAASNESCGGISAE